MRLQNHYIVTIIQIYVVPTLIVADTADITFVLGDEFPFLEQTTGTTPTGFTANEMFILAQKVSSGQTPNPSQWREINVTSQIESTKVNGFITSMD